MNLEIKKRIDLIDNYDAIQLFFELLKNLIEKTNISNDDERIALNIRNDDKKRFSVNINSRLVLMINNEILAVMINDDDLHQISHLNIFNKEIFEKQNNASLVYFNYQTVSDNIELIQQLFVKSCLDYLPLQSKSQYRKYHIDELFNIAMNDSLLNEYLNNVIIEDNLRFNEIINNLRVYLLGENNILKDFKITEVKDNSRWVWISDNQNMIGDTIAHYEIISRRNKIYTEIHFEGNQESKANFYRNINSLAENIEWFPWQNAKSIRFNKVFSFDEENLIKKLADSLLYLEENIGNKVRDRMNRMTDINVLESFLEWLINNDGNENNYFNKNFNSDKEKFRNELKTYETKYFDEFQTHLFTFNKNSIKNDIDLIKKNTKNTESEFYKYLGKLGSGGKNAILGKKHYLKFLDEYFSNMYHLNQKTINILMKPQPLNQILYGPPGTGKTYNTINKAIEIVNPKFKVDELLDEKKIRKAFKDEYNRLVDEGQIVFTTFHQSMTYEDFIEGIKPVIEENEDGAKSVVYEVKDGIFKKISKKAVQPEIEKPEMVKDYTFDDAFNDLIIEANQKFENNEQLFLPILSENLGFKIIGISDRGNLILKPIYSDNSKEYTVSYSRAEKLQAVFPDLSVVKNIDKEFRAVIGGSNSTAYWAVISYINNKINLEKKSNSHNVLLPPKPFVIIIDEINRGNVSQIFGELITLIEEDKRLGNDEALEITLPYSKEKFGVPSNLHIIGTMNTADRSVEALDTALRRRFVFEEMSPKYELEGLQQELYGFKAAEILKTINKRIEKLLDRDHLIGHAYFINKDETTIIDSFYKNIIPLLQEYFFGDYGKIGLVLGSGFIKIIENESIFANFDHLDYTQFEEKESYEIINHKDDIEGFGQAIKLLMNQ